MPSLDSPDDLLAYLIAHPERGALAAYDVAAPADGIAHRVDVIQPIGSVFKVAVLYALAREVAQGALALDEPVALSEVAAFRLAGTGVDVHVATREALAARGVSLESGVIALRDIAWSMITLSDNEATDYLVMRLGQTAMEAVPAQLGLKDLEPPMPVSGVLALWTGPEGGPRPRDWSTRCLRMTRADFRNEAFRRAETLKRDPDSRARVAEAVVRELSDRRIKRLAWTLPRASVRDVAALMAMVIGEGTLPAELRAFMRELLSWPLAAAPALAETFSELGYKPGTIEGSLTGAWFGRLVGAPAPRVVVLSLVDLPLADYRRLLQTAAMQGFERRLLTDAGFFEAVRETFQTVGAQRGPKTPIPAKHEA